MDHWEQRAIDAVSAPDNEFIPRHQKAGEIWGDTQIMHNGIPVKLEGYCGAGMTEILSRNRGVHEPQEERAFAEVMKHVEIDAACRRVAVDHTSVKPVATMIELGSYWAFYSLCFLHHLKGEGRCFLVDTDEKYLDVGRHNFNINYRTGHFEVGHVNNTFMDAYVRRHGIDHVDILHADIQEAELDMLAGATETLKMTDYVFISTHSQWLHDQCKAKLVASGFRILADAGMTETYSVDGLIVAQNLALPEIVVEISKKQ